MLQAEWSLGIIGGASAAARGGNIQSGILFGVSAGAIGGLGLGAMGTLPGAEAGAAHVWGAMAEGAIAGTAAGATTAYSGGKGSIQNTIFWAAMGNISGAVLNGVGGAMRAANASKHTTTKINPAAAKLAEKMDQGFDELGIDIKPLSDSLRVDQSFDIVLNDEEFTDLGLDMMSAYTDITGDPRGAVFAETIYRGREAVSKMANELKEGLVDAYYGLNNTLRKYEENPNNIEILIKRLSTK